MRPQRVVGLGIGIALAILGCARAGHQFSDADLGANQKLLRDWLHHLEAKNWDSLSQLYTEDALFMPPNQPTVRGRAAIRAWMAAFPPISSFSAVDDTLSGTGDLAYARGRYRMTAEGAPADSGKFVEVRRLQPDGSWKMEVDIFNSDIPLPPPPAPPRARAK